MKKNIFNYFALLSFLVIYFGCKKPGEPQDPGFFSITTDINPMVGLPGTRVSVGGDYFMLDTANLSVTVDGQKAKIYRVEPRGIFFTIPLTITTSGPKKVVFSRGTYTCSTELTFLVSPLPEVLSVEPIEVLKGEKVTIKGNNFSESSSIKAWMNGKEIPITLNSPSQFYFYPSEIGTVELKAGNMPLSSPTIHVYDPDEITSQPWTIATLNSYKSIIGEFLFNKDGTCIYTKNGKTSKITWKIKENPYFGDPQNSPNYNSRYELQLGDLEYSYGPLLKLTPDSLVFKWYNYTYKLIPTSKVPIFQEIPDLPFTDILTRPKLWVLCLPEGKTSYTYIGSTLAFLPDGTFLYYDEESLKGEWSIENVLGKPYLKLISSTGFVVKYECTEISFYKLELKDANCYYAPRYW